MIEIAIALVLQEHPVQQADHTTYRKAFDALDAVLVDGYSARFRSVRANSSVVCGEINARNRMGGMAGWQPFVVVIMEDANAFIGSTGSADIMVDAFCQGERSPTADGTAEMNAAVPRQQ